MVVQKAEITDKIYYIWDDTITGFGLKDIKRAWGTILKNAGIKDYRIHDLCHQGASICVENGESLYIVSKMLGHKSQRTTERYAYLSSKPVREAAELLGEIVNF